MPALVLLILIGIVIIWFLLSPFFDKIGSFVIRKINGITADENKNNKEERRFKKHEKSIRIY